MTRLDTDVLVIGTGPMGGTCALALATQGVDVLVVERQNWLADGPRAHITNQRAMEVLRDLGVEQEALSYATPWELMGDTLFTTSLAGEEVVRMRTWGTGDRRHGEYVMGSPCPFADIPQPYLEPILVNNAAARGATFRFNTEYVDHVQDANGVTATLRDLGTGERVEVRARFMVGADGARSRIVEQLGLPLEGRMGRAARAYVQFRADLSSYVAHRPSILYWMFTPAATKGELGVGMLRAIRPWDTWIAGWGIDLDEGPPDDAVALEKIRAFVGDPGLEPEIVARSTWHINQAHATAYSSGRVFCGGDAVHRHPPSSGLGSNTSIQDAFNLAWKLAYVTRGWADASLLESYSQERVPVGEQVVARANQSRLDYAPLNDCFRTTGEDDPVAAGLAKVTDPGPDGVAVRQRLVAALDLKDDEFNAQGVEMNQRYVSDAVLQDPDADPEVWHADPQRHLQATTRPGAKLPHVWLVDQTGHRISTLDVVGRGRFTLLTGLAGTAWKAAVDTLALPFLRVVVIGEVTARDLYMDWARTREVEEGGAILVRPDGHVAWRHVPELRDTTSTVRALTDAVERVLGHA